MALTKMYLDNPEVTGALTVTERFKSIKKDLNKLESAVNNEIEAVNDYDERITAAEDGIADIEGSLTAVDNLKTDLGEAQDDISAIQEDLAETAAALEWEQLTLSEMLNNVGCISVIDKQPLTERFTLVNDTDTSFSQLRINDDVKYDIEPYTIEAGGKYLCTIITQAVTSVDENEDGVIRIEAAVGECDVKIASAEKSIKELEDGYSDLFGMVENVENEAAEIEDMLNWKQISMSEWLDGNGYVSVIDKQPLTEHFTLVNDTDTAYSEVNINDERVYAFTPCGIEPGGKYLCTVTTQASAEIDGNSGVIRIEAALGENDARITSAEESISALQGAVEAVSEKVAVIGNTAELETQDKSTVTAAVNELLKRIEALENA